MCTSSTATPATYGGSRSAGAARKTSSGRSRLPPAASASAPTVAASPGWQLTAPSKRCSISSRYSSRPSISWIVVSALMSQPRSCCNPGEQRDDATAETAISHLLESRGRHQLGELLRSARPADAGRQIRVRGTAWKQFPCEGNETVRPELVGGRQETPWLRDLADAAPPARAEHAPQLAQAVLQLLELTHSVAHRRGVESDVRQGQRHRVAADPLDLA